jgi:hypothetical protein
VSASELQACLAHLYTSAAFRRLVALEAERALDGYFLTAAERLSITTIDADALERFAESLEVKRRRQLERAYPALFALDPAVLETLCRRYHELYPRRPDESVDTDVTQFGTFVEQTLTGGEPFARHAADLARFERLMYELRQRAAGADQDADRRHQPAARRDGEARARRCDGVAVARFHCNVSEIDDALRQGLTPDVRHEQEFIVCGLRDDERLPRILRVSAAVALVVELCDGERSAADVAAAIEAQFSEQGLASSVDDIIRQLADAQILEVADGALV